MKSKFSVIILPLICYVLYLTLSSHSGGTPMNGASTPTVGCGGCHGSAVSATTSISLTGLPAAGYVNGVTYTLTLSITNTSITPAGLGLRDGFWMASSGGSFTAITGTTLVSATSIRHNTPKAAVSGIATWVINWTAPATGTATISFNVAGNATNGDGSASSLDKFQLFSTSVIKAPAMTASSSATPILCNGGVSTITASNTNGVAPVQYQLNAGGFGASATFTNNLAGTYTITAKDATNATASTVITITQPNALVYNAASLTHPACNGGNGSASITASGGTGTKTYSISPLGPQTNTTGNFTGLSAQTYTVNVTDANNCSATTTISISQPAAVVFNPASLSHPACNGGNGSAIVTASGGTGTKTYSITPLGPQTNTTGSFTGLSPQAYTVSVSDANNCTATTSFTITQPPLLGYNTASVTNATCNGGTGSVSITAFGGTGTITYSISPAGPQTNTTGNFTALAAQMYTITAQDANNCSLNTTVSIGQPAPLVVTASNVSGCQGNPIALTGSPAGGTFSVSNPYLGPSTTYTYTYTDGNGCSATSAPAAISAAPVSANMIVMPSSTSFCQTIDQSGNINYANANCELIATVNAGGLGTTNVCVNFLPGTPTWNGQPYANRVYSITPSIQPTGTANVCLYYTSTDINAAGITSNADVGITKIGGNGLLGGPGSVTEILNNTMTISAYTGGAIEVCFPVSSFSSFYLHKLNPGNVPLPVSLTNFYVKTLPASDELTWSTQDELNHAYFNVQQSVDGNFFSTIGRVISTADQQRNDLQTDYHFSNNSPVPGYSYYRLEQVDIDGNITYSRTITQYRETANQMISLYPNPGKGQFTLRAAEAVTCALFTLDGKCIRQFERSDLIRFQLETTGIYLLKITTSDGQVIIRRLQVE